MDIHVGIDIGAKTSAMGWRQNGKTAGQWDIQHTPKGRKAAANKMMGLKPLSVVMEATGIYYLDLALELHAAGLPVSVINPKSFHNFAKLMLQNSKTDQIDAQLLAEYGERMAPRLWVPPTADQMMLRAIGRHINCLIGHRTRAKNELHALQATETNIELLSRYAGLDVRLTQSGTSVNRPGRMSKCGNAYLRAAMFMPAMTAIRCDKNVKAFYEAWVARGKKKCRP